MPSLSTVVSGITTLLAFAGCGYYLLVLWSARSFVRATRPALPDFHPPVSILKPVKGLDPDMYESFASHCRQDYPGEYEILFAVGSPDDPAIEAIERLQREFPERSIRLVLCPETLGTNGKVSSLVQALPHARFDYILISDSDILVSPVVSAEDHGGFRRGRGPQEGRHGHCALPRQGVSHDSFAYGGAGYRDRLRAQCPHRTPAGRRHSFWIGFDAGCLPRGA